MELTREEIIKHAVIGRNDFLSPRDLEHHPDFTIADPRNLRRNVNWNKLSSDPGLKLETIKTFIDKDWDWSSLSKQHCLTKEFIHNNPNMLWDLSELILNPAVDAQFILENLDSFDWPINTFINASKPMSIELVLELCRRGQKDTMDWVKLTTNPGITNDVMKAHPDLPWVD